MTDGGQTFTDISAGVTGNTLWPLLMDAQTYLVGTVGDNGRHLNDPTGGGEASVAGHRSHPQSAGWRDFFERPMIRSTFHAGRCRHHEEHPIPGERRRPAFGSGATFPTPFFSITPIELPDGKLVALEVTTFCNRATGAQAGNPLASPFPSSCLPPTSAG